jgi:hypothetical protein
VGEAPVKRDIRRYPGTLGSRHSDADLGYSSLTIGLHALDSSHHDFAPLGERVGPGPAARLSTRRAVKSGVRCERGAPGSLNEPARRRRLYAAESTGEVLRMDAPRL